MVPVKLKHKNFPGSKFLNYKPLNHLDTMKKNTKTTLKNVIWNMIFIILGAIFGYLAINILKQKLPDKNAINIFIIIIGLVPAIFIQLIVHELGHLLFGKISGYQFISFRIGNLMLVSDCGKLKFKKFTIVGTVGQCVMAPPKCDGYQCPYLLYNLGGLLANSAFSFICLILYLLLPQITYLSTFLLLLFVLGIALVLLNGIPILSAIPNDGHHIVSLSQDRNARYSFWLTLYINSLIARGNRISDIPEELFPENPDLSHPVNTSIAVMKCSYLGAKMKFDEAKALCKYLLDNVPGLIDVYKYELQCDLLFYEIIGLCRKDEIDKIYTKQLKKYIKTTSSYVARKRLLYAFELLVMQNDEAAQQQLDAFEKVAKTYPYTAEVEIEREMMALITSKKNLLK